jgi:hypothetical protein
MRINLLARAVGAFGALVLAGSACAGAAPGPIGADSPAPPTATAPTPNATVSSPPSRPASTALALESCGDVTHFQDGNVGPVLCSDGRPSLAADSFFRSLLPAVAVLHLAPDANLTDVETAMCADETFGHMTNPTEESAYRLMAAEQGWGFGDEPPAWLLRQAC